MVGVHAAFTCTDETLEAAAQLANEYNTGVHIHVAEGPDDIGAEKRIKQIRERSVAHCSWRAFARTHCRNNCA